jgi:hypothetical protein
MADGVAAKLVEPRDCVIAFGIPVSLAEYRRDIEAGARHDFAKRVSTRWRYYQWAVVRHSDKLLPIMRENGARVVTNLTLAGFGACLADRTCSVFILVSHWTTHGVEFADGLATVDDVLASIPDEFDGILDLCVCHPDALVSRIRAAKPEIGLVAWTSAKAQLQLWLYFYAAMFKAMTDGRHTYLEILEEQLACVLSGLELASV